MGLTIVVIHAAQGEAKVLVLDQALVMHLVDEAAVILVVSDAIGSAKDAGYHILAPSRHTKLDGFSELEGVCNTADIKRV